MRVVSFERTAERYRSVHARQFMSIFFVPDEDVILCKTQYGAFGGQEYSLTTDEALLNEAKAIARGEVPEVPGVRYSSSHFFEYNDSRLRELIQDARLKRELEEKVESGIKELSKESFRDSPLVVLD